MYQLAERFAASIDLSAAARTIVAQMESERIIQKSAKEGQVNGLLKALSMGGVPKPFRIQWWAVCNAAPGTFVLGDCCVIARSTEGCMGVPMQFGIEEWGTLYLPISSSGVLAASRSREAIALSADELNAISAEMSSSYIYASHFDNSVADLGKKIGARSTMARAEIEAMVGEVWQSLACEFASSGVASVGSNSAI